MKTTVRVKFFGFVQGVGFRYTAVQYARELEVAGSVQNLPDGSVELIAQGEQEKVTMLVDKLRNYFNKHVQSVDTQPLVTQKSFTDFRVI